METFIIVAVIASIGLNVLLIKKTNKMRIDYESYMNDANRRHSEEILNIRKQTEEDILNIQKQAEEDIAKEKNTSEKKLREMKEFIESRRNVLMTESEKTLLVDVVLALEGYGSRLERIEEKLIVEKIDENIMELTAKIERKTDQIICNIERKLDDAT